MSYQLYDVNGFVGDLASNGGYNDFVQWAKRQGPGRIKQFVTQGTAIGLEELAADLGRAKSDNSSADSVRQNLIKLLGKAEMVAIVNNGMNAPPD